MRYAANVVGNIIDEDHSGTVTDTKLRDALDHSWGRIIAGVISNYEYEVAANITGLDLHIFKPYEAPVDPRIRV